MEPTLDTAQRSQSSFLGDESSENVGGMTMNPPAFQLMASDAGGGENENENTNENVVEENVETGAGLTPAVVTKSGEAELRYGSNPIGSIPKGTLILVGSPTPKGWYLVTHNGQEGYIAERDILLYDSKAIITKRGRADYFDEEKVGDIPEGTEISIGQIEGELYPVVYNNLIGKIHQKDITLSSEFMVPAKVTSNGGTELKDGETLLGRIPNGTIISAEIRDDGEGWTVASYESDGETLEGKIRNDDFTYGDGGNDSMVPAIVLEDGGTQMYIGNRAGSIPIPEGANILADVKETDQNETFVEYNGSKGYIPNSSFLYAHSRDNEMQPAIVTKTGGATMVYARRRISAPQGASLLAEEELDSNGYAKVSFRGGIWYLKPADFVFTNIEAEDYFTPVNEPLPTAPETNQNENANDEESSNVNSNSERSNANANSNANTQETVNADITVPTQTAVVSNPEGFHLERGVPTKDVPAGGFLFLYSTSTFAGIDYYWAEYDGDRGYIKVAEVTRVTPRFAHESTLISVMIGTSDPLENGASGSEISVLQQALLELGYLGKDQVNGTFGTETASALKRFQVAKGLEETEKLDSATMASLNSQFIDHSAENILLGDAIETSLLEKTRNISEGEEDAFKSAIDQSGAGGSTTLPAFENVVDGESESFRDKIEQLLKDEIDRLYELVVRTGDEADRSEGNLFTWTTVEGIASKAKMAVDGFFGNLAIKPAFSGTGPNPFLKDVYEYYTGLVENDDAWNSTFFNWRAGYIVNGSAARSILQKHSAYTFRDTEKAIIENAKNAVWYDGNYQEKVFEIQRNWFGTNDASGIYLQRFKPKGQEGVEVNQQGREEMWELYHTVVHEYFHALEHPDHKAYRATEFPGTRGNKVLWEGIPDYFAQIVVNNTSYDLDLRREIEGPFHEPNVEHPLAYGSIYSEAWIAEHAAGIIGFPNLCAAFFLGQTELYEHSEVEPVLSESSSGGSGNAGTAS